MALVDLVAVAANPGRSVFREQPQDIWSLCKSRTSQREEEQCRDAFGEIHFALGKGLEGSNGFARTRV